MNPDPQSCSALTRAVDEPLAGTAPRARAWLVLEQSGPFGFDALTHSHLPAEVRLSIAAAGKATGTNVILARSLGHHADTHTSPTSRRFWFAHTSPGGVRMRTGIVDDAELTRSDLGALLTAAASGQLPPWGKRTDEPLMLICTNSKRDVCCALAGRPLASALAADPETAAAVLEVSHLGGHRFAPTVLVLPHGYVYGQLDIDSARAVLEQARSGRIASLPNVRGRSSLAGAAQVAELAVRASFGIHALEGLDVLRRREGRAVPIELRWDGNDDVADVEVRHNDGRAWAVHLGREALGQPRPESCGKQAVQAFAWSAAEPVELARWA